MKTIPLLTKFGRLTVCSLPILFHRKGGRRFKYLCKCECGTHLLVVKDNLTSGNTSSCGCFKADQIKKAHQTHGQASQRTKTYRCWAAMKQRCSNPKLKDFHRYGGRGIKVCDRWVNSFENFLSDMGNSPSGMSIERINSDGDYSPENCRWATPTEQSRNRHTNCFITINGSKKCVSEWIEALNLNPSTVRHRIYRGWPADLAITTPT